MVLEDLLHSCSWVTEASSLCTPNVTLCLVQELLKLLFAAKTLHNIKVGLQPFIVANGSAEHRQANLELAWTNCLLNSGEQALLLTNLETLTYKEVQSIPSTYFELEWILEMFGNLLGTVLGLAHPVTTAYWACWTLLSQSYRLE